MKCPTCQINHLICLDCLFEILQKKDSSEVGNIAKIEIYSINTCNPKRIKIKKQATKDDIQFNFIPFERVSSSCTSFRNIGESMLVNSKRINLFSLKLHVLFKPFKGFFSIGVKKDNLNLPTYNFRGQRLVFCLLNVISTESTPLKGFLSIKKSYEAIPNNFKVPSSTTKGLAA